MRAPTPGMLLDERELFRRQRAGLAQHGVADANLADVVQQRAEPQDLELVVGRFICRPTPTDTALTRSEWPAVYGSRASSASASARIAPT